VPDEVRRRRRNSSSNSSRSSSSSSNSSGSKFTQWSRSCRRQQTRQH
jgi:hypothetical protein